MAVRFRTPSCPLALFAALVLAVCTAGGARAKIPEPDHILHGVVSSAGEAVVDGVVTAALGVGGDLLASFPLNADGDGLYVLRLPMDAGEPRASGTVQEGEIVQLFLDGAPVGTALVGAPGTRRTADLDAEYLQRDLDGDGLSGEEEVALGTDSSNADTDGDGMPDGFEVSGGFDPLDPADGAGDPDGDGLSNLQEYQMGSDPQSAPGGGAPVVTDEPTTLADALAPRAVLLTDLDGDGVLDLVVADDAADQILVYRGDGAGGFSLASTFDAGGRVESFAVSDVNGDGLPDLIVALFNDGSGAGRVVAAAAGSGAVVIWTNDGTGSFAQGDVHVTDGLPSYSAAADLNLDGWQDLVVTNAETDSADVFLHDGAGMVATGSLQVGVQPVACVVEDWSGEGIPDLAVVNRGSDDLSVFTGQGDGTFGPETVADVGEMPVSLATGDFDGDLVWDLLVGNAGSRDFSLLVGDGDGAFGAETRFDAGGVPVQVLIEDWDGDGLQDLVVLTRDPGQLLLLLGDGGGGFQAAIRQGLDGDPAALVVGDLDQDGVLDFAVVEEGSGSIVVYRTSGASVVDGGNSSGGGGGGGCLIRSLVEH